MKSIAYRTKSGEVLNAEGELFTGLYDKNEKPIFEGDYIQYKLKGYELLVEKVEFDNVGGEAYFYPFGTAMGCACCMEGVGILSQDALSKRWIMDCEIITPPNE